MKLGKYIQTVKTDKTCIQKYTSIFNRLKINVTASFYTKYVNWNRDFKSSESWINKLSIDVWFVMIG